MNDLPAISDAEIVERVRTVAAARGLSADALVRLIETRSKESMTVSEGRTEDLPPGERPMDVLRSLNAIGCMEGPSDLSTNPKHLKDLGRSDRKRSS